MRWTLTVALALVFIGCAGPTSYDYEPDEDEAGIMARANRDIYPADVRADPHRYKDSLVAWAGVIARRDAQDVPGGVDVIFVVDHRYFDWRTSYGMGPRYLLSTKGEGRFVTQWKFTNRSAIEAKGSGFDVGEMIVVYGRPEYFENGLMVVADYVRGIDHFWFTGKGGPYGRDEVAPDHEWK